MRLRVGLSARALLVHERVERGAVDREPGLFGDLEREVDREPVRVVQQERRRRSASSFSPACLRLRETATSRMRRARWRGCAGTSPPRRARSREMRVEVGRRPRGRRPSSHRATRGTARGMSASVDTEQAHRADAAAHQAAQDVAAALVATGVTPSDMQHERSSARGRR